MSEDGILFTGYINPLQYLEVDEPWHTMMKTEPNHDNLLAFLCGPEITSDIQSIVQRYQEISIENPRLFVAPAEKSIMTKLIWPLRYAKSSYSIGNYLGTIALCGMVSEMIAILTFDTSEFNINGKLMNEEDERNLFGSKFEKLGQDRRVKILKVYNLINDDDFKAFDTIRLIRRKYLHLWSQEHDNLKKDAVSCFLSAIQLVISGLGLSVENGKANLKPNIVKFMIKNGLFTSPDVNNDKK